MKLTVELLLEGELASVAPGLHRGPTVAMFATMTAFTVIEGQPFIQVSLQLIKRGIEVFSESNLIEFFLDVG